MQESMHQNGGSQPVEEASRFPPIASLANISEAELWDMLFADAAAEAEAGRSVNLRRYLQGVPDITRNPEILQAAIAATLENARRIGQDQDVSLERMRKEYPRFIEQIDQAELVDELVGVEEEEWLPPRALRDLPCDYGPDGLNDEPRYVLHELLGIGTRGCVYKALDRTMSSRDKPSWVAIKTVPEWTRMREEEVLAEARRARRVEHESVAHVLDAGVHDEEECFIVCKYVDGVTLAEAREATNPGGQPRDSVRLLLPVIEAMADAHAVGMTHLDIHPRNVLVDRHGHAKLIDFGLGLTNFEAWRPARRPLGSLGFMPPEIYQRDSEAYLPRADVYGLGGLLLWLVSGRIPNGQTVEEAEFRLSRGLEEGDEPASTPALTSIDPTLAAVLMRSLAVNPAERYESAHGLGADLRAWSEHRPISWIHTSVGQRLGLFARRSPGVLVAGATILTLAILGTSAITTQAVRHQANLRVAEAERTESLARAEAERLAERAAVADKMEAFASTMQGFVLSKSVQRTAGRDWVVLLSLVQDLSDAGLALDAGVLGSTLEQRIEIARARVSESADRNGEDDIQTGLWRAALASWLVDAKRYQEATRELDHVVQFWDSLGGAGELFTARLVTLRRATSILLETDQARRADKARTLLNEQEVEYLPGGVVLELRNAAPVVLISEAEEKNDQTAP